jgi:septum formation topological specificity factor MinE
LDLKKFTISPLQSEHKLSSFRCGDSGLDQFITKKATKFHRRNRVKVFCAHERDHHHVHGLYTLTMRIEETNKLTQSEQDQVSDKHFPAIYIGTLAVNAVCQNNKLGTILLMNALQRSYFISQNVAVFGVALRSLNERTTKFYERYGFGKREDGATPLMVLPIWSLCELIEGKKR